MSALPPDRTQAPDPGTDAGFDALFEQSWRGLLLETFAVSGDLAASRLGLTDAFVDLWRQRGRIPADRAQAHVRSIAYQRAVWRHRAHPFHRAERLTAEQQSTIGGLRKLSLPNRKVLVMAALTDLPLDAIAQQVAETPAHTEELLSEALDALEAGRGTDAEHIVAELRALEPTIRAAARPVPASLRRRGRRKKQLQLVAGLATLLAGIVAAGFFVAPTQSGGILVKPLAPTVQPKALLTAPELTAIGPAWTQGRTTDNTGGDGINSFCQQQRFADPRGLKTLVRTFDSAGPPVRHASQTIELSRTETLAQRAYKTAIGWFAGCEMARVQLLSTFDITGLGDEAAVLKFRATGETLKSYSVAIARTGHITTWLAVKSNGASNPTTQDLLTPLTTAVQRFCGTRAGGPCRVTPSISANIPPSSGEAVGMLAVADLPPIGKITQPWVGTKAGPATVNAAATSCDRTNFVDSGAKRSLSRTFLIPGADLPTRFGITETYGQFANITEAQAFINGVRKKMANCKKSDLGAEVTDKREQLSGPYGSEWTMWRVTSKISDEKSITYWMGVTRIDNVVAQVGFVPANDDDITADTFQALIVRARDRLLELDR